MLLSTLVLAQHLGFETRLAFLQYTHLSESTALANLTGSGDAHGGCATAFSRVACIVHLSNRGLQQVAEQGVPFAP